MKIKSSTINICCSTNKIKRRKAYNAFLNQAGEYKGKILVKRLESYVYMNPYFPDGSLSIIAIGKECILLNRYEFVENT